VVAISISGHRTRSAFDRHKKRRESNIADAFGQGHLSHKAESAKS
jgi:hypothetical protein